MSTYLHDGDNTESFSKLSHKLHNQLATMLSSTELLKLQGEHSPDTAALLRTIDGCVHTMVRMLDDFIQSKG